MEENCIGAPNGALRETTVGSARVGFERGEMELTLVRRGDGLIWLRGHAPFGAPLDTIAAAIQFLKHVCAIYNLRLEQAAGTSRGEQEEGS